MPSSSGAPLRGCRACGTRAANLRFRDGFNFGEDNGGFVFESRFHALVVPFGIFSSAVFELEIAKIVIDGVAALEKLIKLAAVRRKIGSIRLDEENEQKCGRCQGEARAEYGRLRRKSDQHSGAEGHWLSHPSLSQPAHAHARALPLTPGYRLARSAGQRQDGRA